MLLKCFSTVDYGFDSFPFRDILVYIPGLYLTGIWMECRNRHKVAAAAATKFRFDSLIFLINSRRDIL